MRAVGGKDSFSPDRADAVGRQGQFVNEETINSQLHIDARAGALLMARDLEHHHIATPQEVAEVIVWLCADAGRTVTGNIIRLR